VDDITIVGGGAPARACADVLGRAGFRLRHAFEVESGDKTPLILGEVNGAYAIARQAVESGRPVLITGPASLPPERLSLLLEARGRSQALFVWSGRRYHPGYRFVGGLMEADATWRPRYVRLETLGVEPTSSALIRWRTLEALALLTGIAADAPLSAAATATLNALRNAPDLLTIVLAFKDLDAFLQIGLGEALERREMLLAAASRKAFVDELNQSTPVRLVEDEPAGRQAASARWVSCAAPTEEELARLQCFAFLDATLKPNLASEEANVWLRALSALQAIDRSLQANGAAVAVSIREEEPRFRVINGQSLTQLPPTVA